MDLYVYYRVPAGCVDVLRPKILAMQACLAQRYTLDTALKWRAGTPDGSQTWMEIYMALPAEISEEFIAELELAAEQTGLCDLIEGCRHIERFMDMSTCA
jgi:hypothetical protein